MDTELIKVTEENLPELAEKAARLLLSGELVALPTETVYGLAANACDVDAIRKIFRVKGRPQDNPVIVHISDFVMLNEIAEVTDEALLLAKRFWPGPLTMVLHKKTSMSDTVTAGLTTVAVRMPSHPVAAAVIAAADVPLGIPSANLSGRPSTTTAQHVMDDLSGQIPLILDAGGSEIGIESTVISLVSDTPLVLRPGMLSLEDIRTVLPHAALSPDTERKLDALEVALSPGLKHKHYSPRAEVILVRSDLEQFIAFVSELHCSSMCAMCFDGEQERIPIPSVSYGKKGDARSQAKRMFAVLRMIDKLGFEKIYVRAPEQSDTAFAVWNRLIRAAGFRLEDL